MRAESAVEPTRSDNITVTWRRSARTSGDTLVALDVVATSAEGGLLPASARRAAIASSSLRRCPRAPTPSSFRSSAVRLGRTVSSISFLRKAASYFPRPRLRSQTTMSMMAPTIGGGAHDLLVLGRCPGQIGLWVSQRFTKSAAVISPWQCLSVIAKIPE
jgi:hypothetical protein